MFCHKCGSEVPEGVRYCHRCGAKLPVLTYARGEVSGSAPVQTAGSVPPSPKPHHRFPGGVWKRRVPALLLGLLILSAAVGGVYWFGGREQGSLQGKSDSVLYLEVFDKRGDFLGNASGFLIEDSRTVVTNYHVIEDAYRITAYSADDQEAEELQTVLAYSELSDLAILQSDFSFSALPLQLSDSDQVRQGDPVYAVGYPLGLSNTMSDGIVSARFVDEYGVDLLQITSPISPGSSGGALLNQYGNVVGVVCATYTEGQNLNLAIASNTLSRLFEERGASKSLPEVFYP